MAWETPKTNWTQSSVPKADDFNRIEENIKTIKTGLGTASGYEVTDSLSSSSIGTSTKLVTERDVYNGLPRINNGHSYSAANTFFAPDSAGTSGYLLMANSYSAPSWTSQSSVDAGSVNGFKIYGTFISWSPGKDDSTLTFDIANINVKSAVVTPTVKSVFGAGPILEIVSFSVLRDTYGNLSGSNVTVQVDNDAGDLSGFYIIAVGLDK